MLTLTGQCLVVNVTLKIKLTIVLTIAIIRFSYILDADGALQFSILFNIQSLEVDITNIVCSTAVNNKIR